jgi:hypothetical protein
MTSREWWNDPRVLDDHLVRRIPRPAPTATLPPPARPARPPRPVWAQVTTDPDTRRLLTVLVRRGFELSGIADGRAYLTTAGPRPVLLILVADRDDPSRVARVLVRGTIIMTAECAARWLEDL